MDKCVLLATSKVGFFILYGEKKTVKECVLDILIRAIIADLGFQKSSWEYVWVSWTMISQRKRKNSVYGKISQGFDKLHACLEWN